MTAPSATRNIDGILAALQPRAPTSGTALEIASGTGQQVARFAAAMPDLHWQRSDIDAARLRSIQVWSTDIANVADPLHLDIATSGWSTAQPPRDLIITVNLLHLIPDVAAANLMAEAAQALAPGGLLAIYGPFLRDGKATSAGDANFDASLRAADPAIGYKDIGWVQTTLGSCGFGDIETCDMPANNLFVFARRRLSASQSKGDFTV